MCWEGKNRCRQIANIAKFPTRCGKKYKKCCNCCNCCCSPFCNNPDIDDPGIPDDIIGINNIFALYKGTDTIVRSPKYLFRNAVQTNNNMLLNKVITGTEVIFESIVDFRIIGYIRLDTYTNNNSPIVPRDRIYLQEINQNGTESSLRLPIEGVRIVGRSYWYYWYNIDLSISKKLAFKTTGRNSGSTINFEYDLVFGNFKNDDALFVNRTKHTYTNFAFPLFDDSITSDSNYISKNNSEFMVEIGGNYDVVLIMDFSLDTVYKLANANAIYIGKKNGDGTITRIPSEKQTLNSDNRNSYIVTWKNVILTAGTTFVFLFTSIQSFPISFSYSLAFNTRYAVL